VVLLILTAWLRRGVEADFYQTVIKVQFADLRAA
jgi:hypothetical protein